MTRLGLLSVNLMRNLMSVLSAAFGLPDALACVTLLVSRCLSTLMSTVDKTVLPLGKQWHNVGLSRLIVVLRLLTDALRKLPWVNTFDVIVRTLVWCLFDSALIDTCRISGEVEDSGEYVGCLVIGS